MIVEMRDVSKSYEQGKMDVSVLKNINLNVDEGQYIAIMGPSGSGKSTFLRCLNRLEEPTLGKILFEGVDITNHKTDIDKHRQKMGMVFQQFNLFPHMTIMKNLTIAPMKLQKREQKER